MFEFISSFWKNRNSRTDLVLEEISFELDPSDLIKEFCFKIKNLDEQNWVIQPDLKSSILDNLFHNQFSSKFTALSIVWNTKTVTIKRAYGVVEGYYAEIFHFHYNKERILLLYRFNDYGVNYHHWLPNFKILSSQIRMESDNPIGFIQNKNGKGILFEKFGHSQIWVVEKWELVNEVLLRRIKTI